MSYQIYLKTVDKPVKSLDSVMPAKAGIQKYSKTLDSRLRRNDVKGRFKTFYETITVGQSKFICP